MKILQFFLILTSMLFLTSCPEDVGADLDTPIFLINKSNDTVEIVLNTDIVESVNDSSIDNQTIQYLFERVNNPVVLVPNETFEFYRISSADIKRLGKDYPARYNFIINVDSLKILGPEKVQETHRGLTKYFLHTIDDYEDINFTMVYPKP